MLLVLVRHGSAEDPHLHRDDAQRPLTASGVTQLRAMAAGLVKLIAPPQRWLVSPYLRAQATAEILADAFHHDGERERVTELLPNSNPQGLLQLLGDIASESACASAVAIGHEPCMGTLVGSLLTGSERAYIPLTPGMAVGLHLENVGGLPAQLEFALSATAAAARLADPAGS